jgi:hypothetical protein
LVLAGCEAEAALEVAVEVALVGESGHRGDGDGRLASLEGASGGTEAVGVVRSASLLAFEPVWRWTSYADR